MLGFWKQLYNRQSKLNSSLSPSKDAMPNSSPSHVGDVYSFKTAPFNKFSEPDTGRYACLKILLPVISLGELQEGTIGFVVLDKTFDHPPTITELESAAPLKLQSFSHGSNDNHGQKALEIAHKYAVCSTPEEWENDLLEFSYIGNVKLSKLEETMRKDLRSSSTWYMATYNAETEWRWKHDKDRLIVEVDKAEQEKQTQEHNAKLHEKQRFSALTWRKMETEVYFKRWNENSSFPSKKFTEEMRRLVKHSIDDLQAIGNQPSRPKVRKVLKNMVSEITKLNEKYDWVIETEEREDIYKMFYDLTYLTKQLILIDEIGGWHLSEW